MLQTSLLACWESNDQWAYVHWIVQFPNDRVKYKIFCYRNRNNATLCLDLLSSGIRWGSLLVATLTFWVHLRRTIGLTVSKSESLKAVKIRWLTGLTLGNLSIDWKIRYQLHHASSAVQRVENLFTSRSGSVNIWSSISRRREVLSLLQNSKNCAKTKALFRLWN